jgi:hypothetical protein
LKVYLWERLSLSIGVQVFGSAIGSVGTSSRVIPPLLGFVEGTVSFWNKCFIASAFFKLRKMVSFFFLPLVSLS